MKLFQKIPTKRGMKYAYGAFFVLMASWLLLLVIYFVTTWLRVSNESKEHNQPFEVSQVVIEYADGVFENLQSEVWQAIVTVSVFVSFEWKNANESRRQRELDSQKLDLILQRLDAIEGDGR